MSSSKLAAWIIIDAAKMALCVAAVASIAVATYLTGGWLLVPIFFIMLYALDRG